MSDLKERYRVAEARLEECSSKAFDARDESQRLIEAGEWEKGRAKSDEFLRLLDEEEPLRLELVGVLKEIKEIAEYCGLTVSWSFDFGAKVVGRRIDFGDDEEMERKEAA